MLSLVFQRLNFSSLTNSLFKKRKKQKKKTKTKNAPSLTSRSHATTGFIKGPTTQAEVWSSRSLERSSQTAAAAAGAGAGAGVHRSHVSKSPKTLQKKRKCARRARGPWGSRRWSSPTPSWTARISGSASHATKSSWRGPTNSSKSSSRTGTCWSPPSGVSICSLPEATGWNGRTRSCARSGELPGSRLIPCCLTGERFITS